MSINNGTLVISAIRPNDSSDAYPTMYSNEAKGGLHTYPGYNSLALIPTLRRQAGMLVNITDDPNPNYNGLYVLSNDLVTWALLSANSNEVICGQLDNLSGSYRVMVLLSSPHIYRIDKLILKTSVGSCLVTCNIDSYNIPEFTNILVNENIATYRSFSTENYIDIENSISLVLNNISVDLGYVNFQIELQRISPRVIYPTFSVCGSQEIYQNSYTNI